jgi:hypothetical protein
MCLRGHVGEWAKMKEGEQHEDDERRERVLTEMRS